MSVDYPPGTRYVIGSKAEEGPVAEQKVMMIIQVDSGIIGP